MFRSDGWYVRVWVGKEESDDQAYDTALYIVGCPTAAEAEDAVRKVRGKVGERLEVWLLPTIDLIQIMEQRPAFSTGS